MKIPKKWFVLWFTGLPCSGKTTLADAVAKELKDMWYVNIQRLDGDEIRTHLCSDLWFSREDRSKNLERVGYVAKLLSENWVGVIASFVSPYQADREKLRSMITNYIEVFVDTPLEVCEERDVKWMYAKARAGIIKDFTGVDDPYERPQHNIFRIEKFDSINESLQQIKLLMQWHNLY